MEENKNNQGQQQQTDGDMGTSENSKDVSNPINTGGKSENAGSESTTVQTRNPTDSGGAPLGTKTFVTGSDFDGQVSR